MKRWNMIRQAVLVQKMPKSEARQTFNVSRTLLQKILTHDEPPGYRQGKPRPKTTIGDFLDVIKEILEADKKEVRKQRHTAKRIFERLRDEHGYAGSERTVRQAVADLKKSSRKVYVPLAHPPGEAQFDFGFAYAKVSGERTKIAYGELSLPYSNVRFLQVFPKECTETFQESLKRAFEFLEGVPRRISFDNSRVAVSRLWLKDGKGGVDPTYEFLRLASHYLFEYRFCRVRQPQEKGHVENAVGYSRRNHLVPIPEFDDFDSFSELLIQKCREDMNKVSARQTKTIGELFREETRTPQWTPHDRARLSLRLQPFFSPSAHVSRSDSCFDLLDARGH